MCKTIKKSKISEFDYWNGKRYAALIFIFTIL